MDDNEVIEEEVVAPEPAPEMAAEEKGEEEGEGKDA